MVQRTIQINYDLRAPGRNYQPLYDWIKTHAWAHPLESLWLIRTTKDVKEVYAEARARVDSNDLLLIIDVTGDAWWTNLPGGPGTAVEWMHSYMGTVPVS